MTLASMTGFATAEGQVDLVHWAWEVKTVNGKGLDIRLRLPSGYERLDTAVKKALSDVLRRGTGYATLSIQTTSEGERPVLNEAVLTGLAAQAREIAEICNVKPPSMDGLLSIRGVVELREVGGSDGQDRDYLDREILAGLTSALRALKTMRNSEGAEIKTVLLDRLKEIEALVVRAETAPARTPEAIRQKIEEQINRLLGGSSGLDQDRLYQEAVLLAAKVDIREELDRLTAHVQAARDLLASGEAVGRRLDFLAQEFNREANTLCSKSNDSSLTAIGLDLKSTIDQLREQIQNVE